MRSEMAALSEIVQVQTFSNDTFQFDKKLAKNCYVDISKDRKAVLICSSLTTSNSTTKGGDVVHSIQINGELDFSKVGKQSIVLNQDSQSFLLKFPTIHALKSFHHALKVVLKSQHSVFVERTEEASAVQYFQFYGYLSQQQNMMQDYIRTSSYQRAVLSNISDFEDKIVLDVGAGSGILSFFAIQAGAKRVYAIEASSMAKHCETLVKENNLEDRVIVIAGKVEEVDIPEEVDTIISEPMGYMLLNERMLESYLHAKKWLKPKGKMFPTQGDLHIAPFTDEALYMEQFSKANFWYQQSFYGVDLVSLREAAVEEYFKQPIVDTFDIRICMARTVNHSIDFEKTSENELHRIEIPLSFTIHTSGIVHGLAFWFDVAFHGSCESVWLSTSPTEPLTHWYQVRCLLHTPVLVKQGQSLVGKVVLKCNTRQSYDVDIEVSIPGTPGKSSNSLDLKNPFFRYTGQAVSPPPGANNTSPSEAYWANVMGTQDPYANGMVNGMQEQSHNYSNNPNLIPLSATSAPVNPGSIPSVPIVNANRTSIGGGLSPAHFNNTQNVIYGGTSSFPVSNQFMIGDYVTGNVVMPQ